MLRASGVRAGLEDLQQDSTRESANGCDDSGPDRLLYIISWHKGDRVSSMYWMSVRGLCTV